MLHITTPLLVSLFTRFMTAVTYFDVWRLSAFARTFGGRGPPTERRTVDRGRVQTKRQTFLQGCQGWGGRGLTADVDRPGIDWVGLSTVQFILCRLRRNICLNSGTRAVIHVRLTRGYFLPNEGKGMLKFYFPSRAAFIKNSPTVSERREPRNNSK